MAINAVDRAKQIGHYWKDMSRQERVQLMTFSIAEVEAQAKLVAMQGTVEANGMVIQHPPLSADPQQSIVC